MLNLKQQHGDESRQQDHRITGIKYMRDYLKGANSALGPFDGRLGKISIVLKVKTGDSQIGDEVNKFTLT